MKTATPSSADRFADNWIGKITKATPATKEQAARDLAEYEAKERALKLARSRRQSGVEGEGINGVED